MIIYNTTFQVEINEAENLVAYLHKTYIPDSTKSGLMKNPRLARILSHKDPDSECFSLQFEAESSAVIHRWYSTDGVKVNKALLQTFSNKVVGFPTMMEVIE